jgi:glycosyltransferase involved in cell wall biosynthesis
VVLEAVTSLPDLVLAFQGAGPMQDSLEDRTKQLGLEDRVAFMGMKSSYQLHEYACGADIGLVIYESTTLNNYLAAPNKLFAYLMAGLPVAGSNFPGLAQIIGAESVGVTFDPGDASSIQSAFAELSRSATRRSEMGARSRQLAESRFNWESESGRLLEVYERLARR